MPSGRRPSSRSMREAMKRAFNSVDPLLPTTGVRLKSSGSSSSLASSVTMGTASGAEYGRPGGAIESSTENSEQYPGGIKQPKFGSGKWFRNRRYIRVNLAEALGLSVATTAVGSLAGAISKSYLIGGLSGGAIVLTWYCGRLLFDRLDHKEIGRTMTAWDDAGKTMSSIIDALNKIVQPSTLRHNLLLYLAVVREAHRRIIVRMDKELIGTSPTGLSHEEVADLLHVCRLSSAAYGPLLIILNMLDGAFGMSSKDIIKLHTHLTDDDFVAVELDGELLLYPRHYIAYDHMKKCVVLSIRGTLALSDVATDVICMSTEFLGGVAHDGMKTSANILWEKKGKTIIKALEKYPDYSLLLTGHSMGAGTAVLLALKLLMEPREATGLPKDVEVRCTAFATPPVFGPLELVPEEVRGAITSIQYRDDVVPSLSLAGVTALIHSFRRIDDLQYDMGELLSMVADGKVPDELVHALEHQAGDEENFPALYVPGRRLWFLSPKNVRSVDDPLAVNRILITDTMVINHFVNAYEDVLIKAAKK